MTYQGVIGGTIAAAFVGLHSGTNVRRPWTHVPWTLMLRKPELFGEPGNARWHVVYLLAWSFLLALYAETANALVALGVVPGVAQIYPTIGETVPPRVGPASEVFGAFVAALTVHAIVKKLVNNRHRNVSATAVDLPPAAGPIRRRSFFTLSAAGIHKAATFALHVIEPFYERLWQRDGAILKGGANALLDQFGETVCSRWLSENVNDGKPLDNSEVPAGLLKALMELRFGGYPTIKSSLMLLDNRTHKRNRCADQQVGVRLEVDEETVEARLYDYSHGGAAIVLASELPLRQSIRLFFDQLTIDMEVVHCRIHDLGEEDEKFVIGMRCKSPFAGRSLCEMLKGNA